VIGASIISITLNPLLFRAVAPVERWIVRRSQARPRIDPDQRAEAPPLRHRAVVVGYGPIGRTVSRLLGENEIAPTVIEMNVDTVRALRSAGIDAVYGDAAHATTLTSARIADAGSLIVSVAGVPGVEESFRVARQLNPSVQILARATHLREVPPLRAAGADVVVSGEGEVALAFTAAILERLGASPEQVDRERTRLRAELG